MDKEHIQAFIARIGGPVSVAADLAARSGRTLSHSAICQWNQIPAHWVLPLERLAADQGDRADRHDMRPDIFGPRHGRAA